MRAWSVERPAPIDDHPLALTERPEPVPAPDELLVRVRVCGVCRTDLHLAEGDLDAAPPGRRPRAPGGRRRRDAGRRRRPTGSRSATGSASPGCAGPAAPAMVPPGRGEPVPASRRTPAGTPTAASPSTPWCRRPSPTGCPRSYDDVHAAPLLCAGIIGYRALRRAALPPGGRLGIYGFGSSAHITAQIALAQGAEVLRDDPRRGATARWPRDAGRRLGGRRRTTGRRCRWTRRSCSRRRATLVPVALEALDRGGTLALAGIHMTDVPPLDYERHLFRERDLRSVTSNTRRRRRGAARAWPHGSACGVHATAYPFGETDRALARPRRGPGQRLGRGDPALILCWDRLVRPRRSRTAGARGRTRSRGGGSSGCTRWAWVGLASRTGQVASRSTARATGPRCDPIGTTGSCRPTTSRSVVRLASISASAGVGVPRVDLDRHAGHLVSERVEHLLDLGAARGRPTARPRSGS